MSFLLETHWVKVVLSYKASITIGLTFDDKILKLLRNFWYWILQTGKKLGVLDASGGFL